MRIPKIFATGVFAISAPIVSAQNIQAEVALGEKSYYYQHTIVQAFTTQSKFGFFNTSSALVHDRWMSSDELMSQVYVRYALSNTLSAGLGTIYITGPGIRPSFALHYFKKEDNWSFLLAPRADFWKTVSYEVMSMVEYQKELGKDIYLYVRVQLMTNWGTTHNRSYQYARVGLGPSDFQLGLSAALDEWGSEFKTLRGFGFFVRKVLPQK